MGTPNAYVVARNQSRGIRQQRAALWAKWRVLVTEQSQSDRGLRDSLFYDWKKRFRADESGQFVGVKVKESKAQREPVPGHYSGIEIRLHRGRSLFVEPGFDAIHLRALLAFLETDA